MKFKLVGSLLKFDQILLSSSQKQRRSDVPVGQQDKGEEDGEGELEEVPEPNDVVRVHAKVGCDYGVIR